MLVSSLCYYLPYWIKKVLLYAFTCRLNTEFHSAWPMCLRPWSPTPAAIPSTVSPSHRIRSSIKNRSQNGRRGDCAKYIQIQLVQSVRAESRASTQYSSLVYVLYRQDFLHIRYRLYQLYVTTYYSRVHLHIDQTSTYVHILQAQTCTVKNPPECFEEQILRQATGFHFCQKHSLL